MVTEARTNALSDVPAVIARFLHPEKLPALHRIHARPNDVLQITSLLSGVSPTRVEELQYQLTSRTHALATELLSEERFVAAVENLPFRAGDIIVALGDSITDDALSWAHLLQSVLDQVRPTDNLIVRNHGITGHTSGEVISRIDTIMTERPDWIIQLLGTNDARLHGLTAPMRSTSSEETARNLGVLRTLIQKDTQAQLICMTPLPVIDTAADKWEPFRGQAITWRDTDVQDIRKTILGADPSAVDLYSTFSAQQLVTLLEEDGVHPNERGQQLILRTLVNHLATGPSA